MDFMQTYDVLYIVTQVFYLVASSSYYLFLSFLYFPWLGFAWLDASTHAHTSIYLGRVKNIICFHFSFFFFASVFFLNKRTKFYWGRESGATAYNADVGQGVLPNQNTRENKKAS